MAEARTGYSGLQIGLHWAVVILVAVQLVIGDDMGELVEAVRKGEEVEGETAFRGMLHYWLGIAVLGAMVLRLGVRLVAGAPDHAGTGSRLQTLAATAVHWAFYVVLLAAPVSGLVAYYGIADVGRVHGLVKPLLIVLIGVHVLAALYNQFVRRDGTLMRMVRPR